MQLGSERSSASRASLDRALRVVKDAAPPVSTFTQQTFYAEQLDFGGLEKAAGWMSVAVVGLDVMTHRLRRN
jgi:hypothetical protein